MKTKPTTAAPEGVLILTARSFSISAGDGVPADDGVDRHTLTFTRGIGERRFTKAEAAAIARHRTARPYFAKGIANVAIVPGDDTEALLAACEAAYKADADAVSARAAEGGAEYLADVGRRRAEILERATARDKDTK